MLPLPEANNAAGTPAQPMEVDNMFRDQDDEVSRSMRILFFAVDNIARHALCVLMVVTLSCVTPAAVLFAPSV